MEKIRTAAVALTVTMLAAASAAGQTSESAEHPYGLDPYKPSDAALLRNYGGTLVAQTPLSELRKLDPYKPSHAALLRDLGGAFPLWGITWFPAPLPASLTPFPLSGFTALPPTSVTIQQVAPPSASAADTSAVSDAVTSPPSSITTLRRPENSDGVWITFAEQKWISAGKAVPFEASEFERVGENGIVPVFKRTRVNEEVIYLPTREGLVAPYRLSGSGNEER
jgi:hypothetical protein